MKISFEVFGGMRPKIASHLLDKTQAQTAKNIDTGSGKYQPLKAPGYIADLANATIGSLYRWDPNSTSYWIGPTADCDFVRAVFADDTYERLYFTGESQPRFFANDAISDPFDYDNDYIKLGVPDPAAALTATGYTPGSTYRAYVYTFVNRYGEEGPPSPLVEKSDYGSGNVTLAGFSTPTAGHAIERIRVYRTNSSAVGLAEFQVVFATDLLIYDSGDTYNTGDLVVYNGSLFKCVQNNTKGVTPVGSAAEWDDWYDGIADGDLQPDTLVSSDWEPPPSGLKGLTALPGGILCGFVGNRIYMTEVGYAHAWPQGTYSDDFTHTVPFEIVGVASHGTALVVMTIGPTYLLTGSQPDQMSVFRMPGFYPCMSKRSIAGSMRGIFYACRQGLALATYDGVMLFTKDAIDEDSWQDRSPGTMRGVVYDNAYFGFYGTGKTGCIFDLESGVLIDVEIEVSALWVGDSNGILYLAGPDDYDLDNPPSSIPMVVRSWQSDTLNTLYGTWKSGVMITPFECNFGAARVVMDADWYDALVEAGQDNSVIIAENASIFATGVFDGALNTHGLNEFGLNGDLLSSPQNITSTGTLLFKYYADGNLKLSKALTATSTFRLPSGFRARKHEAQLEGYPPAHMVEIASGIEELMQ